MKPFRLLSILLGVVSVTAFSATAVYWFWIALTNEVVAERGNSWYCLAPLGLLRSVSLYLGSWPDGLATGTSKVAETPWRMSAPPCRA